jgi:hypothetical protein
MIGLPSSESWWSIWGALSISRKWSNMFAGKGFGDAQAVRVRGMILQCGYIIRLFLVIRTHIPCRSGNSLSRHQSTSCKSTVSLDHPVVALHVVGEHRTNTMGRGLRLRSYLLYLNSEQPIYQRTVMSLLPCRCFLDRCRASPCDLLNGLVSTRS